MWLNVKKRVVVRRSGDGIEGVPSTGSGLHPTFKTDVWDVADSQPANSPVAKTTRTNFARMDLLTPEPALPFETM